ncbi:hypothetical protein N9M28_04895 [Luminiphilus sp.]|nr:hypothetical protein [Luminiphilus sp.]
MVDTLPTFDEDYGATGAGDASMPGAEESDEGAKGDSSSETAATGGTMGGTAGSSGNASSGTGTRAGGGMDANRGTEGPLTSAERVAILDRQLEESTRDFDGIIYDEEQRQREADRARTTQTSESSADTNTAADEESTFGGSVASTGSSSVGGGIGGSRGNAPPTDGAKYPPPGDIPTGNDDDVVARQLREAAMREADPEVREKLWNEYRKYKGIEVPAS